jgi:pyruvate/2-oxoglutarate dehydrogenase complex dihydrolipoamide dehydrogenase (E3) component
VRRYDLAVVGGGTAGLVAALIAAGVGARVCLIERAATGGDCLWTGCVPSKSLLAAASLAQRMRTADAVGLAPVEPDVDLARVLAHVRAARDRLAPADSPERLRRDGVEVLKGEARFAGPGRLAVAGRTLAWRSALVATGSSPVLPPVPGLATAEPLTSDTVWDLRELPGRLLVLGGGPVGCELGQGFARLGSRVTIVELLPWLLGKEEPEARALVARRLAEEGVEVRLGCRAVRVERDGAGHRLLLERDGQPQEPVGFDRVLVAAGRRAQTDRLGLEAVGVATHADGAVVVDRTLRTTAPGVFAAGDVTGALPFTHVAAYHGRTVAGNAVFGLRRRVAEAALPWVTFTDPEVARVGLSEAQARERWGRRAVVAVYDYAQLDRAVCAGEAVGFAKLVADPRRRLVGATVAAPAGGEAIAELAAWVARGGRIGEVSRAVRAYPTFAEGPGRAADELVRARWTGARARALVRPTLALARLLDRPW